MKKYLFPLLILLTLVSVTYGTDIRDAMVFTGNVTLPSGTYINGASLIIEGSVNNDYETTVSFREPSADRTIEFPNASGMALISGNTSAYGFAMWSAGGVPLYDTGNEVCALAGLACTSAYDVSTSMQPLATCSTANANKAILAFCH